MNQVLGLAALLLSGCTVETYRIIGNPVWSNDETEVAFTVVWYDVPRRDLDEATSDQKRRNEQFQYFRVPADLSEEPTALGERRSEWSDTYYMLTAGYLLAREHEGDASVVKQIRLDGEERIVASADEWPSPVDFGVDDEPALGVAPSPNGRYVALFSVRDLEPHPSNSFESDAKIVAIDDPDTELAAFQATERISCAWLLDGSVICGGKGMSAAWREGQAEFAASAPHPCPSPPTSSTRVSSTGKLLIAGVSFDEPFAIAEEGPMIPDRPDRPFGCE